MSIYKRKETCLDTNYQLIVLTFHVHLQMLSRSQMVCHVLAVNRGGVTCLSQRGYNMDGVQPPDNSPPIPQYQEREGETIPIKRARYVPLQLITHLMSRATLGKIYVALAPGSIICLHSARMRVMIAWGRSSFLSCHSLTILLMAPHGTQVLKQKYNFKSGHPPLKLIFLQNLGPGTPLTVVKV